MALGAPRFPDPDVRHGIARIHLLLARSGVWHHLVTAMPDGFSPGSREWSGSAVLDSAGHSVMLYFPATGRSSEHHTSFEHRLFQDEANPPRGRDHTFASVAWQALREL